MNTEPIKVERLLVTPDMARKWLGLNIENNRRLSVRRIADYARDMKNESWTENGETIKFTVDMKLIDGQHRLLACVEANVGFYTLVAWNVPHKAFVNIDRNQSRSTGQLLHLVKGISDYNNVAAALAWLYRFRDGFMLSERDYRPTAKEILDLAEKHKDMPESVRTAIGINRRFKAGSVCTVAVCHYLFTRQDKDAAEGFFSELSTGADLRQKDPVFKLRERLLASYNSQRGKRLDTYDTIALYFKAWQAYKEKRTFGVETRLTWHPGESFPNIGPVSALKHKVEGPPPVKPKRGESIERRKPVDVSKLLAKPMSLDKLVTGKQAAR